MPINPPALYSTLLPKNLHFIVFFLTFPLLNLYTSSSDKRAEGVALKYQGRSLKKAADIMCRRMSFVVCMVSVFALPGSAFGVLIPGSSITAQAASQLSSETSPDKSVNGAGMLTGDYRFTHDNKREGMWLSAEGGGGSTENHPFGLDSSTWVMYGFDRPYQLGLMRVYNYNEWDHTTAGLQDVYVHYSVTGGSDAGSWINLGGIGSKFTFTQASGRYGERGKHEADFHGVFAKYVVLTAAVNNGNFGHTHYGLAEVRFDEIPEPCTLFLLGLGGAIFLRKRRN